MYAQGRLLEAHYPIVPLAYEFGLSFAVFSYNQRVFVGAIADAAAVDDLEPAGVAPRARPSSICGEAAGVEERAPGRRGPERSRAQPGSHPHRMAVRNARPPRTSPGGPSPQTQPTPPARPVRTAPASRRRPPVPADEDEPSD